MRICPVPKQSLPTAKKPIEATHVAGMTGD
jgi:hypothetical protein